MPFCRGCGEEIKFVELKKSGKMMPVNPEPLSFDDMDEGVVLVGEDGTVKRSSSQGPMLYEDQSWYVSHFATCSEANKFRKER